MQNGKIKAVVLDWSGTVSDDRRLVWTANMAIFRHYGLEEIHLEEFITNAQGTVVAMAKTLGIRDDPETIIQLYTDKLTEAKSKGIMPQPYSDAAETLAQLNSLGVNVMVLSSHPTAHLAEEAELFGLRHLIAKLVGDSYDKVAGLATILQELGLSKAEMLYAGDTTFDIRAANEVGVYSGGISTGYHTRERLASENPDFLFDSLREILEVVKEVPA